MNENTNDIIANEANLTKKKVKKKFKKKPIIISVVLFFLFVISLGSGYVYYTVSKVNTTKISHNNDDLNIKPSVIEKIGNLSDPPRNIALFGVDRRGTDEYGNSDTIIIASIDKANKKIKLSSIMRDTRVSIDGVGMSKLNAAYCSGGPELAIKTINKNFDMNIKDFVTVDFFDMEKIIEDLGGVSINIEAAEIPVLNDYLNEVDGLEKAKKKSPRVTKPGIQNLSGKQAVAYSRIRYIGNGDFKRTERQRTVLTALLTKIQSGGVTSFPSNVNKLLPYVETSFSTMDILSIGKSVLTSGTKNIEQTRFPTDGAFTEQKLPTSYGLQDFIVPDLPKTIDQLHAFVFKDIMPK